MRKSSSITILCCGLITLIATILFYLFVFKSIFTLSIRWLSLLVLMIVEALGTIKAVKANNSIFGTAIIVLSGIHLVIAWVISIIFVNIFPFFLRRYVLLNLLIILIVTIIDVLIFHFDNKQAKSNKTYSDTKAIMDECFLKAQRLLTEFEGTEYEREFKETVDMFKYSNDAVLSGGESDILSKIDEINDLATSGDNAEIKRVLKELNTLIKLRSMKIKKRGKF